MQYVQGPKMDWTEDAGLHQRFKDWMEEVELLMDTVLSHIRSADTKMKFVTLWAGKEARTYLSTLEEDHQNSEKTAVKHIDSKEQPPDYFQSEYTTPYFITNEQAKAPIKCLKTTARVHHIQDRDTDHIRPLWVAQSRGSQVFQTDCEVDTGAGCNILPVHKAQQLFGHE